MKYDPNSFEKKWQQIWDNEQIYQAAEQSDKVKYYSLVMFPYPSGDLHIGHWYSYTGPDVFARFKRLKGFNVLHPFGFDAFGMPAENAAIKRGLHPHDWTQKNITAMISQIKATGASFDWTRVVDTSSPDYYRWTQWLFLQFYKHDLVYRKKARVIWCETDQTVLANEQVEAGLCWRCGNPVIQKELEQWFFRISKYADQLLDGLEELDWPAKTKLMQSNWIGRSEGLEVDFNVEDNNVLINNKDCQKKITVFTTRPDTLFGVTYLVIAPESHLVTVITSDECRGEVEAYQLQTQGLSERERQANQDQKTGVFTGGYASHPLTSQKIPIWIADYVISSYGTGAVMGVPAHDQRDWEFAQEHHLATIEVITGGDTSKSAYVGLGTTKNSSSFDNLTSVKASNDIADFIQEQQIGKKVINYRLRDWSISRQRYWGAPIPMIDCPTCGLVPVPESDLPVVLPRDVDFMPKGQPPLATNEEFMVVSCPQCQQPARRVPETLDTFVDSSWYYLRYIDPDNKQEAFSKAQANKWMPVDMYVGGAEHTVLHLLYSRFFTKSLRDMGYLDASEPFTALRHQGTILGPDHQKMSKSKGNVVNPDDLVRDFGADAVRMQLLFMGPYDQGGPWQLGGIQGVYRLLQKLWTFQHQQVDKNLWSEHSAQAVSEAINSLIIKAEIDIAQFKFNTAIATLMSTWNCIQKEGKISRADWEIYLVVLSPFAPHSTEEMWHTLGNSASVHRQTWPVSISVSKQTKEETDIIVQVNGRVRARLTVSVHDTDEQIIDAAKSATAVSRHLDPTLQYKPALIAGKVLNFISQA